MGWYSADLMLIYQIYDSLNNTNPKDEIQRFQLLGAQEYTFIIPYNANYFKGRGARLLINAVGGAPVMNYIVDNDPLCFHIWGLLKLLFFVSKKLILFIYKGGSLNPSWSVMGCW